MRSLRVRLHLCRRMCSSGSDSSASDSSDSESVGTSTIFATLPESDAGEPFGIGDAVLVVLSCNCIEDVVNVGKDNGVSLMLSSSRRRRWYVGVMLRASARAMAYVSNGYLWLSPVFA